MSQRGLEALLRPESIAVVGASNKPGRAGYLMMRNLLDSGFNGPVLPVTPAYRAVCGVLTWRDVISLPMHAYLDEATQQRVIEAVTRVVGARR